jgi:predicted RNase H-like HicB family nuclease
LTFTYPAVFRRKEDGTYEGFFPDLQGCVAKGETLDECINDAIEAERTWLWIELTEEEDADLPFISDHDDLVLQEGDIVRNIEVILHLQEGNFD